jgi:hypothetical protein
MEARYRRGGLVGPVILIGLGVIFLLNNLGRLDWGVWLFILRLWPVLLIGAGLDLLVGRRSIWGSLLVVVVMLGVLAGAVLFYQQRGWGGTELARQSISRALEEATSADVTLDFGLGALSVGALSEGGNLIEGTVELYRGERLVEHYAVVAEEAQYSLSPEGDTWNAFPNWPARMARWDVALSPNIPVVLTIDSGVGETVLDLRGLQVIELSVDGGLGTMRLTLPAQGDLEGDLNVGIGAVEILVPQGVAVRMQVDGGLSNVVVPAGYVRDGDVYTSPGYASAENRVLLHVEGGIGQIRIQAAPMP